MMNHFDIFRDFFKGILGIKNEILIVFNGRIIDSENECE